LLSDGGIGVQGGLDANPQIGGVHGCGGLGAERVEEFVVGVVRTSGSHRPVDRDRRCADGGKGSWPRGVSLHQRRLQAAETCCEGGSGEGAYIRRVFVGIVVLLGVEVVVWAVVVGPAGRGVELKVPEKKIIRRTFPSRKHEARRRLGKEGSRWDSGAGLRGELVKRLGGSRERGPRGGSRRF
jgi:hypothetical protein